MNAVTQKPDKAVGQYEPLDLDKALARPIMVAGHELEVFVESEPLIAVMIAFWITQEFFAVILPRKVAAVIRQVCAYEMGQSRRVTLADCRQRPWWHRLLNWVAWSFRWWL